jgi:AcrR family transcriptional regulator
MSPRQRSQSAILAGAKEAIAQVGSYESNMVDIAARAKVSRATVYNNFADKEEMLYSLIDAEIDRLTAVAHAADSPAMALYKLSQEISTDPALRRMVVTDPEDIALMISHTNHPLWLKAESALDGIFGDGALVMRWLIGQVTAPLNDGQGRAQAAKIARSLTH